MILLPKDMIEEDQGKLSSAPLDVEYDNNSIKQSTVTALR